MKQHSKLSSEQQQQHASEQQSQTQAAREFASTEELMRHDAAEIQVPPQIEQRLAKSIAGIPQPSRSWWSKLFRK